MKKLLALGLAAALTMGVFTACAGDDGSSVGTQGYPGTPGSDSVTVNLGGEPPTLFNVKAIDSYSNTVIGHVMDMLVIKDKDGNFIPDVAESWE